MLHKRGAASSILGLSYRFECGWQPLVAPTEVHNASALPGLCEWHRGMTPVSEPAAECEPECTAPANAGLR